MFHTYVTSVCSKCFICFGHMLHSSVSCCLHQNLGEERGNSQAYKIVPIKELIEKKINIYRVECDTGIGSLRMTSADNDGEI